MKACIVAEGCYPYVVGGVSGWVNSMIQSFPNIEFIVLAIVANRSLRGKFAYELPKNVTQVYEVYLQDEDWYKGRRQPKYTKRLDKKYYKALCSLILDHHVDWNTVFELFRNEKLSVNSLLMGQDFLCAVQEAYRQKYAGIPFADYLWTMRSIYLPLFLTLKTKLPQADFYHCVATGYAGVLGSMAKNLYGCPLLISEHGIYTREREEELIKAKWVKGIYKNIWIEQFRKMSLLAYQSADLVTSLYKHAQKLQIEIGCPKAKTIVTPNGIDPVRLQNLPGKGPGDKSINIGAVLRVVPIKDVKTMISAFGYAKQREPDLKLWIMGSCEEEQKYAQECYDLVENMQIQDVIFTGQIDVRDYLGKMDMTILTSISEGQPLTILESFAAHKPVIATDVGNCRGLLYGEGDSFGAAGILTHIMNIQEIAQAMLDLAQNAEMRRRMGENGYRRFISEYQLSSMKEKYREIYQSLFRKQGVKWAENTFVPHTAEGQV